MERSESANGDDIFDTIFITKVISNDLSQFVPHSVPTRFLLNMNKN
jgi:hypothetical protein